MHARRGRAAGVFMVILASRVASLPFLFCFLLFSVTGCAWLHRLFLRFPPPPFHVLTTTFSHSPFLHFCDIGDSAARRQPLPRIARRPPVISNEPFISDEIGKNAATWETAGPVSSAIFITTITGYKHGINASAILFPHVWKLISKRPPCLLIMNFTKK